MSLCMIIKKLRQAAMLTLLAMLASSCQWITEDYDEEGMAEKDMARYINITISVSASESPVTRANPNGGEYGDGVEKGIETRENEVKDITLIFYELPTGASLDNPGEATVSCVVKYDVHRLSPNHEHVHEGAPYNYNANELLYTTGDKLLERTALEVGKTYHVLVVANVDPLVVPGDPISTVREKLQSQVYTGSGIGVAATDFVMASSADETVTLTNPTVNADENKVVFNIQCLHIERLAARIDYCTKNGTYEEYTVLHPNGQPANDPAALKKNYKGYKYAGSGNDFFVVTKVALFNLYNENEYYFKRVRNNWSDAAPVITRLGDETTSNWVVDPNTVNKTGSNFSYLNPISEFLPQQAGPGGGPAGGGPAGGPDALTLPTNAYTRIMADVQDEEPTSLFKDSKGFNNVIVGYVKENTLRPESPLKTYATGIAFEIKYYVNQNAEPRTRVFYHYLRHQGENDDATGYYQAKQLTRDNLEQDNATCGSSHAMNYGVVRNNIYRISVHSLNPQEGILTIKVEEEKWRHVDNPVICI